MNRAIDWALDHPVLSIGSVTGLLVGALYWAMAHEHRQWQEFASAHECRVVGRERGGVSVGYAVTGGKSGGGMVVIPESDKVGYLCNDGVTYWRPE